MWWDKGNAMENNDKNLPKAVESKEDRLIRLLSECDTVKDAALKAGYSESFANSLVYHKLKQPKFQKKLREYYVTQCHMAVPKIAKLHSKVLDYLNKDDNFKDLPKYDKTHRFILQSTGIIAGDDQPRQPVINIKNIGELSIKLQEKKQEALELEEVQEAEAVEKVVKSSNSGHPHCAKK